MIPAKVLLEIAYTKQEVKKRQMRVSDHPEVGLILKWLARRDNAIRLALLEAWRFIPHHEPVDECEKCDAYVLVEAALDQLGVKKL